MEQCPRPECDGTLVVEQIGGGRETTCRACGRHPRSPRVELPPTRSPVESYTPPWIGGHARKTVTLGKRKSAELSRRRM